MSTALPCRLIPRRADISLHHVSSLPCCVGVSNSLRHLTSGSHHCRCLIATRRDHASLHPQTFFLLLPRFLAAVTLPRRPRPRTTTHGFPLSFTKVAAFVVFFSDADADADNLTWLGLWSAFCPRALPSPCRSLHHRPCNGDDFPRSLTNEVSSSFFFFFLFFFFTEADERDIETLHFV